MNTVEDWFEFKWWRFTLYHQHDANPPLWWGRPIVTFESAEAPMRLCWHEAYT